MSMPTVVTLKVLLFVNVIVGILDMDLIVLVSKLNLSFVCLKFCTCLLITYCLLFLLFFLDIDECLTDPCYVNASCTDTESSFVCQCNSGFSGNGFNCSSKSFIRVSKLCTFLLIVYFLLFLCFVDIDECLSNPCHVNASCSDTEGSFVCQCHAGYSGNGFNCSSK
jgi:hypothetical protein